MRLNENNRNDWDLKNLGLSNSVIARFKESTRMNGREPFTCLKSTRFRGEMWFCISTALSYDILVLFDLDYSLTENILNTFPSSCLSVYKWNAKNMHRAVLVRLMAAKSFRRGRL